MVLSMLRYGARSFGVFERNAAVFPLLGKGRDGFRNAPDTSKTTVLSPTTFQSLIITRQLSKHLKSQKVQQKKYKSESDSKYRSSSDSDDEVLGHRGESEFWRRKMRTFHGILDVNNDGVISYDDFKLLADRFVNLGHLSEKQSRDFQNVITDLWIKLWGEITPYNLVTVERYLEDMHHVLNDRPLKKKAHAFLPFLFKAIDHDKSGTINIEDFKLFFKCLGLEDLDAVFSFRAIDTNGDGKLTMQEFVSHGRQFFLTEDPEHISKYFWGPLVVH